MVEKIKETLIQHPEASISQFLVITFTKDAAQNMKDKLRVLLENASQEGDAAASKALGEIETACISTIHSFCTQLLKEYNDNSHASMNPRVLKEAEKKRMMNEAFTDAVESLMGKDSAYSKQDKRAVNDLLTAFKTDDVMKMVQDLYNVLMGIPAPFAFLEKIVQNPPYELWNQEILTGIDLDVLELEECLRRERELLLDALAIPVYEDVAESDRQIVEQFLAEYQHAQSAEEKHQLLESYAAQFVKAPSPRGLGEEIKAWKKQIDEVRNVMKGSSGILSGAVEKIETVLDEKNAQINAVIQQQLRCLELIVKETAAQYEKQKLDAGAIDYADMEQIAYQIMSDPDKRDELLNKYKYVYVDECQDVSGIQDAIIKSLTGPGHQFFMVGDIKQSIYGFRHAEPDLFEHERRTYSDDENAVERRIF